MISIRVEIELPTDDPKEAYEKLVEYLEGSPLLKAAWSSTDEWYDDNGDLIEPSIVYPIITSYWTN